jgi:hypothetical protein
MSREQLVTVDALIAARRLKDSEAEDQFEVGACRVTSRYRTMGGDFVSKQVLGCHNAICVGRLRCEQQEVALERVANSKTVIALIGPDDEVEKLSQTLGEQLHGVIITGDTAIVAG